MRRLLSIAVLGTLTLLSSTMQSQIRGGGGGGMRSSGGGGGAHMSSPAPHVSAGRPVGSGFSSGPAFRGAPVGRPTFSRAPFSQAPFSRTPFSPGSPRTGVNHFTAQNHVFFSGHDHHFHSGFFHHNHLFFHNGFFGANCFGTFAFGNPFCGGFNSAFFFGDPFFSLGFGFPGYGYGYGYYPPYAAYPPPDYYPSQSSGQSDNSNEVALTAEIQRLSDEIDDLRDATRNQQNRDQQDQDRQQSSAGGTLSAVPPSAQTIFILRDGRRFTAQNYAVSGQTLWILNEHTARKTPLSDIDYAATEKANEANGIEIRLPEATPPR